MLQYCTLPGLRPFRILHCDFGLPSRLFTRHPFRARIRAQNTPALSCRQPIHHMRQPLAIAARSIRSSSSRGRHCSIPLPTAPGPPPPQPSPSHRSHHPSHRPSSHLTRRHVISPSCHLIMSSRRHVISCCHASRHPPAQMLPCATSRGLARQPTPFLVRSMSAARRLRGAAAVSARERIIRLRSAPSAECGACIKPVLVRAARRPSGYGPPLPAPR